MAATMTDAERFCHELQSIADFATWSVDRKQVWARDMLRNYQAHVQPTTRGQRIIFPDYSAVENNWRAPFTWHALPISDVWKREYRQ